MKKVYSDNYYDYYKGLDVVKYISADIIYNIVPKGTKKVKGGYKSKGYIEKIKGVKFPSQDEIFQYYIQNNK